MVWDLGTIKKMNKEACAKARADKSAKCDEKTRQLWQLVHELSFAFADDDRASVDILLNDICKLAKREAV